MHTLQQQREKKGFIMFLLSGPCLKGGIFIYWTSFRKMCLGIHRDSIVSFRTYLCARVFFVYIDTCICRLKLRAQPHKKKTAMKKYNKWAQGNMDKRFHTNKMDDKPLRTISMGNMFMRWLIAKYKHISAEEGEKKWWKIICTNWCERKAREAAMRKSRFRLFKHFCSRPCSFNISARHSTQAD